MRYKLYSTDVSWFQKNIKCQATCPASTNVPAYVSLILQGRYDEAYTLNKVANVLPGILGRVCTHPCESQCRRGKVDEPVAICALKRFAADEVLRSGAVRVSMERPLSSGRQVGVIGAGPVGLTAACDLTLLGHKVTVYESQKVLGGMLRLGIPEYRLPREVIEREIQYVIELGVEILTGITVGKGVSFDALSKRHDALLIAVGAHKGMRLGVPGEEELSGVIDCVEFLRQVNLGDRRKPGDRIVIVGGGNSAIDSARTALRLGAEAEEVSIDSTDAARTVVRLGASQVSILYRRSREEMPANSWEIVEAEEEGVTIHFLTAPVAILGEARRVTGLKCMRMELGEPDESGRRRPIPIEGSEFIIPADVIVVAIGQRSELSFLPEYRGIEVSPWSSIVVDEKTLTTDRPGVFAAGDAVTGPKTVIEGVAAGHRAAASIDEYLLGNSRTGSTKTKIRIESGRDPGLSEDFDRPGRPSMPALPVEERTTAFDEVELGFTKEMALQAAERCLRCDFNIVIDPRKCVLCGRCVNTCPNRCIKMVSLENIEGGGYRDVREAREWQSGAALIFDEERCLRCRICIDRCPAQAISMVQCKLEEARIDGRYGRAQTREAC